MFWVYADRAAQQTATRAPLRLQWLLDASGLTSEPLFRSTQARTEAFRDALAVALQEAGLQVQGCPYTYLCASSAAPLAVVTEHLDTALRKRPGLQVRGRQSLREALRVETQRLREQGRNPDAPDEEWLPLLSRTLCGVPKGVSLFLKRERGRVTARVSAAYAGACAATAP